MKTKSFGIIQALAGKGAFIFNDKLKSGGRSIKVWGWSADDYLAAKTQLEAAGLPTKLVANTESPGPSAPFRLHVTE